MLSQPQRRRSVQPAGAPSSLIDPHARVRVGRALEVTWAGVRHAAALGRRAVTPGRPPIAEIAAYQARLAFQELGPTFIKFGQVVASSPGFPAVLIREFEQCLDRVPPEPVSTVRATLEAELGRVEDHFEHFDWTPLAAGSIAQVFGATTVDGRDVVVKVQRHNLHPILCEDLALITRVARLSVKMRPQIQAANPVGVIEDFAEQLAQELSFNREAAAMDELREVLSHWPVRIPAVLHELSTDRVLVMERLHGVKMSDEQGLDELGVDRARLIDVVFGSVIYTGCRHGAFHGDMHAGNITVCRDGQVGLFDFGIIGRLPDPLRLQVSELLQCLFQQRWERLAPLCFEIAAQSDVDIEAAVRDLTEVADRYLGQPLGEMPLAEMLGDILQKCNRYGFVLPHGILSFFKTILYLDGLGVRLQPGYEVLTPEYGLSLMEFLAPETGGAPAGDRPSYSYPHVLATPAVRN